MIYTFTRTSVSDPLTVNFSVGGAAVFTNDYTQSGAGKVTGVAGKVTFGYGQSTAIVTIDPKADTKIELDESVILTVTSGTGYNATGIAATGTITNDDGVTPTITLAVSPASVAENGAANMLYTFTRTGSIHDPLTVHFSVGGAATFNTDYLQAGASTFNGGAGTVTFGFGQSTATVVVNPKSDSVVESDEDVILTVLTDPDPTPTYLVGGSYVASGVIINDDSAVTLAVSSNVAEDGVVNLVYTFTRTGSIANALSVNFNVGGTATLGTDYAASGASLFTASHGNVTIGAGNNTAMVTIDPTSDTIVEANETVILTITSSNAYTINSPSTATGTILDNDAVVLPTITVNVSPSSVAESGTTNLVYTLTRTLTTPDPLTVGFSVGGTATFITDYTQSGAGIFNGSSGTVTFGFGQSTAIVTINPQSDTTPEPGNENVVLTITANPSSYTIGGSGNAIGVILDNDSVLIPPQSIQARRIDAAFSFGLGHLLP
ncbi:MAG: hypothetical protein NT013_31200 [Planctomycetia bacterium]|nr:hypothetical protein [Planctomycetia bacterium]